MSPTMTARHSGYALSALAVVAIGVAGMPTATADNKRLNDGVVANVYTMQHQAGCTTDIKINPKLRLAAQWHTDDVLNNRALDSDIGSDGIDGGRPRAQRRLRRTGGRDGGDQSGAVDQWHRVDQPVVLPTRLQRDHVGLLQRRHRRVVGEPDRPHRSWSRSTAKATERLRFSRRAGRSDSRAQAPRASGGEYIQITVLVLT